MYVPDLHTVELKPWARRGGVQVGHVHRALNCAPLGLHPLRIRRFLLGGELLRHVLRNDRIFRHLRSLDRKSTRLNSSHLVISYAVFCLKKKKKNYSFLKNKKKKKNI